MLLQQLIFSLKIYTNLLLICSILFYIYYSFLIFTTLNLFENANAYKLFKKKKNFLKLILSLTRNFNIFFAFKKSLRNLLQQQYCLNSYLCLLSNFAFVVFSFYYYLRNLILIVAILSVFIAIKRHLRSF